MSAQNGRLPFVQATEELSRLARILADRLERAAYADSPPSDIGKLLECAQAGGRLSTDLEKIRNAAELYLDAHPGNGG